MKQIMKLEREASLARAALLAIGGLHTRMEAAGAGGGLCGACHVRYPCPTLVASRIGLGEDGLDTDEFDRVLKPGLTD